MALRCGYFAGDSRTADHADVAVIDVWDCITHAQYGDFEGLIAELKRCRDAGMLIVLNLHRLFFHTQWDNGDDGESMPADLTWTLRVDYGAFDRLDRRLQRERITPFAVSAIDEPLTRFFQSGRDLDQGIADVRTAHAFLAARWPTVHRWLNFSALEIDYLPHQPNLNVQAVSFDWYLDSLPPGDLRPYDQVVARLKRRFPGAALVLVPDAWVPPGYTTEQTCARVSQLIAMAKADPTFLAVIAYRWEPFHPHSVANTATLREHYTREYRALTGRV